MTKILIIGITGTLGHKIAQELSANKRLIIHGIFTNKSKLMRIKKFIKLENCHKLKKIGEIIKLIKNKKFDYVINVYPCLSILFLDLAPSATPSTPCIDSDFLLTETKLLALSSIDIGLK